MGHALGRIPIQDPNKSLDEHMFIAALLCDVQSLHSDVYTPRSMKLDLNKIKQRMLREGISFLTKALPRLARAFDRALTGEVSLDATGFVKESDSQLPRFLGGLFKCVFTHDGWVLPEPCVSCIATIRQVLYLLYKYGLPYERDQEQEVIDQFERTDEDILSVSNALEAQASNAARDVPLGRQSFDWGPYGMVIARARCRIARLFAQFNPRDITPSHGPGAVSTRERLWGKWKFSAVSQRTIAEYPLDEFFYSSLGHVCDSFDAFQSTEICELSARVCLVPKDSRGPRLISCEPLSNQWIQQGLSRAIVKHVESHPLTRWNIHFTDQQPNQFGALLGSLTGKYATLDLKEASDRISVGLVRLLFPEPLLGALMGSRSLSTELPDGRKIKLNKYAPMGSALCFPVLAISIWALLTAAAPDADTRESVLVYGDDVVVPTAFAENATEVLESFGLKVNRDKSYIRGFFRESCGVDAYKGTNVTPVRIRTVWSSHRCPHSFASWVAYANSFWEKKYYNTYWYIADKLFKIYREVSDKTIDKDGYSLYCVPEQFRPSARRVNSNLQKLEYKVWAVEPKRYTREIDGWSMLLRYFTEGAKPPSHGTSAIGSAGAAETSEWLRATSAFDVRSYTKRKAIKLVKRWR